MLQSTIGSLTVLRSRLCTRDGVTHKVQGIGAIRSPNIRDSVLRPCELAKCRENMWEDDVFFLKFYLPERCNLSEDFQQS